MTDDRGLHAKFTVRRNDDPFPKHDSKHYGCDYFVLDLTHDAAALTALDAYATAAAQDGRVRLAADLRAKYLAGVVAVDDQCQVWRPSLTPTPCIHPRDHRGKHSWEPEE